MQQRWVPDKFKINRGIANHIHIHQEMMKKKSISCDHTCIMFHFLQSNSPANNIITPWIIFILIIIHSAGDIVSWFGWTTRLENTHNSVKIEKNNY